MAHHKATLPEKFCAACGRPFAWRRKWAANWAEVRYCSDACRSGRRAAVREQAGQEKAGRERAGKKA